MSIDQILLRVVPRSILPLPSMKGIVRILTRRRRTTSSVTLLSARVDLDLRLLVVQAVGPLLRAVVLVGLDSPAGHLVLTTSEVELVEVGRGHAGLVELVLDSALVLNIVVAEGADGSALGLARTGHAVHVVWVLDN